MDQSNKKNDKRINLLPGDLKKGNTQTKRFKNPSQQNIEYTEVDSSGDFKHGKSDLSKQKPYKGVGFFNRLFGFFKGAGEKNKIEKTPPKIVLADDFKKQEEAPKPVVLRSLKNQKQYSGIKTEKQENLIQSESKPIEKSYLSNSSNNIKTNEPEIAKESKEISADQIKKEISYQEEKVPEKNKEVPSLVEEAKNSQDQELKNQNTDKISEKKPESKFSSSEMNLLSQEYRDVFSPKHQKSVFVWVVASSLLVVVFAYAFLHLYQIRNKNKVERVANSAENIQILIDSYKENIEKDKSLGSKINAINHLLENHISFVSFFDALEGVTIPEVSYDSISVSKDGFISVSVIADSYTSLARQLTVFEEAAPWINSVSITSASLTKNEAGDQGGVTSDVLLVVQKELFKPNKN